MSAALNTTNKAETAVSLAALILADEGIKITAEKLQTLLEAARIEDVEPIWTNLFAKALQDKDVKDILTTVTVSASEAGHQKPPGDAEERGEPDEGVQIVDGKDGEDESDMEGGMFDLFG